MQKTIHTLGPQGTNCQKAAKFWLKKNNMKGDIILHDTLENAVKEVKNKPKNNVILSCVVYPKLHNIVFTNKDWLKLSECFICKTYDMVFAKGKSNKIYTAALHPAVDDLIKKDESIKKIYVDSNSKAAQCCSRGEVDSCITTMFSAKKMNLNIINSFGTINMGFAIHSKV